MDLYTPTKDMEGISIPIIGTPETPDAYVPTRIAASTSNFATPPPPSRPEETTTRQKYGGTESYSPSVPGIRIVKRKPKESEPSTSSQLAKTAGSDGPKGDGVSNLKQNPKKGILRLPGQERQTRRIFFADTRGFPLCAIKEIERLASIHNHSNYADFRTFEKNEACIGWNASEMDWNVVPVKGARALKDVVSESGKREKERIENLPHAIRLNIVPINPDLEDNPELALMAQADCLANTPIRIPCDSITAEKHTLQTLRDLPLPGRKRPNPTEAHSSNQYMTTYSQNTYEQLNTVDTGNVYQASMGSAKQTEIHQVFQETDQAPHNNYYTSTSTVEEAPKPKVELPASLNNLLSQLKKKGLVSSEDNPTSTTTPLASAMQAAQQMMQNQQATAVNSYSQEINGQEFVNGYDGYIAEFVTPEMSAQELRQDSRHAEGWTQSGFKINEHCAYFLNRRDGCNRGDQCRFLHDDEKRRQKQVELHSRRDQRHDGGGGFRGNRRGNFRGGFRNNHHDRDFRGGVGGFNDNNRFAGQGGGFRRGFDQPPPQREEQGFGPSSTGPVTSAGSLNPSQMDQQQLDAAAYAQMYGQGPAKKRRTSRFDQREEDGGEVPMMDHRPPRRNRFDEGPAPGRQFRSRFDEKPRDQDERAPAYMGQRSF